MWVSKVFFVSALVVCAEAQKAPPLPPPPPATEAAPVVPATPATPPPGITGPDGVTLPVQIIPAGPTLPPNRVVVTVGGISLTAGQLDQILEAYSENQRIFVNGPGRQQFIDQLVRVLLLFQEGKKRKLDETDKYRNQLTYSAAGILSSHTEEDIRKNIKVDDGMLHAYLDAHPREYLQLHARHILIRTHGSPLPLPPGQQDLTEEEGLAKARDLRKRIVEGADFGELAKAESADLSTRETGGDLGFFKRGQLPPSIEDASFALKPGEISQPVKTSMGYTLIKLEEAKPVRSFEELRPELERNVRNEAARKYVEELKMQTKIEIDPQFASPSQPVTAIKPKP